VFIHCGEADLGGQKEDPVIGTVPEVLEKGVKKPLQKKKKKKKKK